MGSTVYWGRRAAIKGFYGTLVLFLGRLMYPENGSVQGLINSSVGFTSLCLVESGN